MTSHADKKAYRRLFALGALSLALHAVVISWFAHLPPPERGTPLAAPEAVLAVRLKPLPQAPAPAPSAAVTASAAPQPAPPPPLANRAGASAPPPAAVDSTPPTLATDARDTPAADPLPGLTAPVSMPGRYRTRMPASARLAYTVTRAGQPAGAASLDWSSDGEAYTLRAEGVTGAFAVEGGASDAGVAPRTATERRADGTSITTTFGEEAIAIDGRDYPNNQGSQDRASVLMQLSGMGLAAPNQIRDVIEIYVAGAREPEIMRFQVEEDEELSTPLGALATRHLVQMVRIGEPRLEVWLAPERGWLPVQLRVTAPDGTVSTQTVSSIEGR